MIKIKKKVAIVAAKRSAIGKYKKTFNDLKLVDIAATVVSKMIEKIHLDKKYIDETIIGCVLADDLGQNISRQIALKSGIDENKPAFTVNMVCGSGMKSTILAYQSILLGENRCVLAGGVEFMSNSNYMMTDGLTCSISNEPMGITAERIQEKYNISRLEQDEFALKSVKKAIKATEDKIFLDEIVPINGIDKDEHLRYDSSLDKLSSLKPIFKEDGTVTAGNASGVNDGVSFTLLMDEDLAKELKLEILGYIEEAVSVGNSPSLMGLAPIPAVNRLLDKTNNKIEDIDLFEINEAFAVQALAVTNELKIPYEKLNVNGGAIALGHPIGASGNRIVVTLVHELKRRNLKKGIASLCVGGGQGVALLVSR